MISQLFYLWTNTLDTKLWLIMLNVVKYTLIYGLKNNTIKDKLKYCEEKIIFSNTN